LGSKKSTLHNKKETKHSNSQLGYGKMLTKRTFVSQSGIAAIPSQVGKGTQIFPCPWKFASEFSMELPSLQQVLQATKVRPHPPGQK
jgi:hypothetical protein